MDKRGMDFSIDAQSLTDDLGVSTIYAVAAHSVRWFLMTHLCRPPCLVLTGFSDGSLCTGGSG